MPILLARPERTCKSMPGENLRRLRRARPLPVKVEACRIPLGAEFVNRLRPYHLASREPICLEPACKLAFRPEGRNVRSSVTDVVPEAARRNQKVNDSCPVHHTIVNLKAHGLASGGRVSVERAITKQRKDRQPVPRAVREPLLLADGDNEVGLDARERMGHPNRISRHEYDAALVGQVA